MNTTSTPASNATVPTRFFFFYPDTVFNLLGSVVAFDYIQLCFVTPVMIIGAFLEIFLIYIFNQKSFSAKLYFFLKFYCLNSAVLNLISIVQPIMGAKRLVPFATSEAAVRYNCYFFIPLSTVCYSVSNIMDLVIQIEKLKTFIKPMKFIDRVSPFKVCLIVLIFSIVYQLPLMGQYTYQSIPFPVGPYYGDYLIVYTNKAYDWTKHLAASIVIIGIYFTREVITLVLNLIFGVLLWISFRKYSKKREEMLKKRANANKTGNDQNNVEAQHRPKNLSSAEIKTTAMVLSFGIISLLKNIPIIAVITWGHVSTINTAAFVIAVQSAQYLVIINNLFHIVIYYIFDKNFKREFKNFLSLKWNNQNKEVSVDVSVSAIGK